MSGKNLRRSALEERKQLLIAESDINRALALRECQALAGDIRGTTRAIGEIGALILSLRALLAAFKRRPTEPDGNGSYRTSIAMKLLLMGIPILFSLPRKKAAAKNHAHPRGQNQSTPQAGRSQT